MAIPDPSINVQTQGGDSAFENLFVFGQLNYDFDRDDLKIRSIDVTSESAFAKDVTFSGSINVSGSGTFIGDLGVDELTARNANVTGIVTTSGDFYALGRFRDVNSNPGAAGQILASTGNGVDWIDANTTSVNNSINVGVNLDSTDADQFVSFFGANSGNQPNRVDNDFTYNPSTNTLTVGTISATTVVSTGSGAFISGMIIAWSGSVANIPTGFVLCDGNNSTPDLRDRFIIGAGNNYNVGATGGSKDAILVSHSHTTLNFVARSGYAEPRNFGVGTDGNCNNTGGTDTQGESGTNKNLPPYHALCYIMKT